MIRKLVGRLNFREVGRVDTKNWPLQPGGHSAVKLKETFEATVTALNGKKIRVYYLHKPDRSVPYEETLEAINDIHKTGALYVLCQFHRQCAPLTSLHS